MGLNFGQNLFPARREPIISYDYFDVANGVGYQTFYGGRASSGAYFTTVSPNMYSETIKTTSGAFNQNVYIKGFEEDFDITFNVPKIIKGNTFIAIPVGFYSKISEGSEAGQHYTKVEIFHYDGTTATPLGNSTSEIIKSYPLSSTKKSHGHIGTIKINIPQTHFKAGETLRFNVQAWASGATSNLFFGVGHDPGNRIDVGEYSETGQGAVSIFYSDNPESTPIARPTRMSFEVPFKLDL